jgi:hypothetical protein
MTPRKPLARRTFLRGALGGSAVALSLPLLDAMIPTRRAQAEGLESGPIFGIFYWANGMPWHSAHGETQGQGGYPDLWTPAATGPGYVPSTLLTPIAAHQVSIVTGLEPKTIVPPEPPGQSDGHMRGWHVAMTGDQMRSEGFDHPSHTMTVLRPTLDQYVATHEQFYGKAPPRFRSLVLGVSEARFHDYGHWNAISYSGPDAAIPPISSTAQLYSMLFDVPGDLVALGRRAVLLDAVLADAQSLRTRLGAVDKARLDAHLESLDEIQRRLELTSGTCDNVPPPPGDSGDLLVKTELMAQMLATALQCDLTRVFSFMLTSPATTHVFSNLGVANDMHKTCHDGAWDQVRAITDYQMQAFARFMDQLAKVKDAMDLSLMDRACIFGTSEYGEGWQHSDREMPVILAGRACGKLIPNVHVREPSGNISKAQVTMLRAIGLDTPQFGFSGGETSDQFSELLA